MKRIYLIFCLMLIPFFGISQKNSRWAKVTTSEDKIICDESPWELVFEDNFDGDSLDVSQWIAWDKGVSHENGGKTQEFNTKDNAIVSNGTLKIVSKKETVQRKAIPWEPDDKVLSDGLPNSRGYDYTSSSIWTKSRFLHGKLEARLKIPKGWGFFPAFWMYGEEKMPENKKKRNNEIDVFEFANEKKLSDLGRIHHSSVHYDGKHRSTRYKGGDFSADFHIFTMIWEENKIEFYVDGILKRTDYKYKKGGKGIECQLHTGKRYKENKVFPTGSMNIYLNTAIQAGKDNPNATTPFPAYMEVDYVRYYQRLEDKVKQSIRSQLQTYPKSTLQDIYKNLFQDRFGPEHIISDTASARLYLEQELASFETSNSVDVEYLGINHNYVRVSLSTVKQGKVPPEKLLTAFCNSAKKITESDIKQWHAEWKKIVEIIKGMDLNIADFEHDAREIDTFLSQGKYAMHHSAAFRDNYQPHYRIVEREIFERELRTDLER